MTANAREPGSSDRLSIPLSTMPSLSLQTHLVSARPQLPTVSTDPKGFKSSLQSLINFLIAHQVPATLWLKLPKGDAWWTDIWQYAQTAVGSTIYSLGDQTGMPPDSLAANLQPIAIDQDDDLKREYLCIAVADSFTATLLAVRTPPSAAPANNKRTISLYCSTSGQAVTGVSKGIAQVIERSIARQTEDNADAGMAGKAVLSQWERLFPASLLSCETLPLTESFLTWQMQFQEELRSQLVAARSPSKEPLCPLSPDFIAKARQELHSPVTTIKTALTLLGSPALKLAQRQRYLDMISTECDRQKSLINSITELIKVQTTEALPPQEIQLANLIPGIVSTYQPIAEERGIMLAYTIPPNLAEVLGIESELKEIVIHLIKNGIQITPQGGRVWVTATAHNENFLALTVQDSGTGVSKADTNRIFEAFYRQSTGGESSVGLGLTLVQHLVNRMGGSISVERAQSKGTLFKLLLPIGQIETPKAKSFSAAESAASEDKDQSAYGRTGDNISSPLASV